MKKTLELCKVRQGEIFVLDGVDFIKLDDCNGAVFAVTVDAVLKNIPFEEREDAGRKDRNNYCGSNLYNAMCQWVTAKYRPIYEKSEMRPIDLTTMDGMKDYDQPNVIVRALTIDEYRKYRRFIQLTDVPYWLATGRTTKSSTASTAGSAYAVSTDGTVSFENVYDYRFAARPAFYLKYSVLVSVRAGEEGRELADFTDKELIGELSRRVVERDSHSTTGREGRDEHGR